MIPSQRNPVLPEIPPKRYFTISEAADLCCVRPHVLRYWERVFTSLAPIKRQTNRRAYRHGDIMLIRQIRSLLYDEGYTVHGVQKKLSGVEGKRDYLQSHQIIRESIVELNAILKLL